MIQTENIMIMLIIIINKKYLKNINHYINYSNYLFIIF